MTAADTHQAKCFACRFEASAASDKWDSTTHPPLGTINKCPECGSTDIHNRL